MVPPFPSTKALSSVCISFLVVFASIYGAANIFASYPGYNGKIVAEYQKSLPWQASLVNADGTAAAAVSVNNPSSALEYTADGRYIAYISTNNGIDDLYLVDTLNNSEIQVTDDDWYEWLPLWSPDESQIAYLSCNSDWVECSVGVVDANGQNRQTLASGGIYDSLSWSPDGTRLLATRYTDDTWNVLDLHLFDLQNNTVTPITNDGNSGYAVWLSNSTIVYQSYLDGDGELFTMNIDGTSSVRLTTNTAFDSITDVSPDGSKVLFTSDRDGNYEIYSMNINGSGLQRLTTHSAYDMNGTFSQDGTKILFISDRDGDYDYYVMGTDGTVVTNITKDNLHNSYANWYDSDSVIYLTAMPNKYIVVTMDKDGSNFTEVTGTDYDRRYPSWHPSDNKIIYSSLQDGNYELYTIEPNGANAQRLTNHASADLMPHYSPDGSKIVFSSNRDGDYDIYLMDDDGTNLMQLTNAVGADQHPYWSPDGQSIVFHSSRDGNMNVMMMGADGANPRSLTSHTASDGYPSWSPDGQTIAFSSNRTGDWDIYTIGIDGSSEQRLTSDPALDGGSDWMPDGQGLIFHAYRSPMGVYRMASNGADPSLVHEYLLQYPRFQSIANKPPITTNDQVEITKGQEAAINVLLNDTDEEGLVAANLTITAGPLNGEAFIVGGEIRYVPDQEFVGNDQLTYQICDSFLLDQQCAVGVVTIKVLAPNAPALSVVTIADGSFDAATSLYRSENARPTFSGTATPGATIKVEIHSDPIILTTTAGTDGNWSATPSEDLPVGEHTVYISATLNGVTTQLDSFVLGITADQTIPNTGASTWPLRSGGLGLLVGGMGLAYWQRRRLRRYMPYVPDLFA